ncbi:MAG: UPF0179 family protein [Thermoproteota archaeon]|nr:UPF0179 family protein [Candidatus Brockarchaeota archaeon]MBO3768468.1 UPF0179 family protein [Candidatus Brockarchaeota archaeon]MBO3801361.1 UPF0179 family protein [Candidatus Brockarchaeota archaeon]
MNEEELFTLLDSEAVKIGETWIYLGEAEECRRCSFRQVCHRSLVPAQRFVVVEQRDLKYHCELREKEVKLFKIKRPNIKIAIESRLAKVGAIIEVSLNVCNLSSCPYEDICMPLELAPKPQKLKILEIVKKFPCPQDPEKVLALIEAQLV